jgi:hypothetical protein
MNSIVLQAAVELQKTKLAQLIPVLFGEDTVILVEHNAHPYVVMKPLVVSLGLDWPSQYSKLTQKFGSSIVEIATVADDGKLRKMVCLSLLDFPGWLHSLNPGKVRTEVREKVVLYQEQSNAALWQFWTGTYLPQHSVENATLSRLHMSYERERTRISLLLGDCAEMGLAQSLYDTYVRLSNQIGALVVPLAQLAPGAQQKRRAFGGSAA